MLLTLPRVIGYTVVVLATTFSATVVAAGLGQIHVRSGLGQPLKAVIPLLGADPARYASRCTKVRIESLDGTNVLAPALQYIRNGSEIALHLRTRESVNELALNVSVAMDCEEPFQRQYQVLLDPVAPLHDYASPPLATATSTATSTASATPAAPAPGSVPASAVSAPIAVLAVTGGELPATVAIVPAAAASASTIVVGRATGAGSTVAATAGTAPVSTASAGQSAPSDARRPQKPRAARVDKPAPRAGEGRSVLRLAAPDEEDEQALAQVRLRMSSTLSRPVERTREQRRVDLELEQTRLAVATDSEEVLHRARAVVAELQSELADLQSEIRTLRQETERQLQESRAEKVALEQAQQQSLNWLIGLGSVIAVCLGAIIWLLWRFMAMQRSPARIPWNEFDTLHGPELAEETEFGASVFRPTVFEMTAIHDTEMDTVAPQARSSTAEPDGAGTEPERAEAARQAQPQEYDREYDREPDAAVSPPARPTAKPAAPEAVAAKSGASRKRATQEPAHALKAEEISDVMELVDAWMALNNPVKVLELLKPFSDVERPQSPLAWLCLLDVYRALGDRDKYEAILRRIRNIYNVRLAPWDEHGQAASARTLADYPHVIDHIVTLWKTGELRGYLDHLLHDNREGEREGFELPVYRDLLRLIALVDDPDYDRSLGAMEPRAYALLFGLHAQRNAPRLSPVATPPVAAPSRAAAVAVADSVAAAPATVATAAAVLSQASASDKPQPRLRERPKYITPSYERSLLGGKQGQADAAEQESELAVAGDAVADVPRQGAAPRRAPTASLTGAPTTAPTTATQAAPVAAPGADAELPSATALAEVEEELSPVAIKLHLAVAYQDIGDTEGAALLLEEVIEHGTPEQAEKARVMRIKLPV